MSGLPYITMLCSALVVEGLKDEDAEVLVFVAEVDPRCRRLGAQLTDADGVSFLATLKAKNLAFKLIFTSYANPSYSSEEERHVHVST